MRTVLQASAYCCKHSFCYDALFSVLKDHKFNIDVGNKFPMAEFVATVSPCVASNVSCRVSLSCLLVARLSRALVWMQWRS
jgi:hypothetical protein